MARAERETRLPSREIAAQTSCTDIMRRLLLSRLTRA